MLYCSSRLGSESLRREVRVRGIVTTSSRWISVLQKASHWPRGHGVHIFFFRSLLLNRTSPPAIMSWKLSLWQHHESFIKPNNTRDMLCHFLWSHPSHDIFDPLLSLSAILKNLKLTAGFEEPKSLSSYVNNLSPSLPPYTHTHTHAHTHAHAHARTRTRACAHTHRESL